MEGVVWGVDLTDSFESWVGVAIGLVGVSVSSHFPQSADESEAVVGTLCIIKHYVLNYNLQHTSYDYNRFLMTQDKQFWLYSKIDLSITSIFSPQMGTIQYTVELISIIDI